MTDNNKSINANDPNETGLNTVSPYSRGRVFEIRIKGQLNPSWSEYLEDLQVKFLENGEMILYGPIVDQAALMGVLNKLSYLNLTLLSVNEAEAKN